MSTAYFQPSDLSDSSDGKLDDHEVTKIINAFYGKAYEIASSRMDSRFLRRFSPTSVANSTAHGLVEWVSRHDLATQQSHELEYVMRRIIDNKLSSGFRRHSAKKRSVLQSVPLHSASEVSKTHDPSGQLIADELYELIAGKLHDLHGFDLRFRLAELGLLLYMPASEIRCALEDEYPNRGIPSVPNIRKKLGRDREVLRVYLKQVWELEDE